MYFTHTIPNVTELLLPLEHTARQKFNSVIIGGHLYSDNERVLLSLSSRIGGLNESFFFFQESSRMECKYSRTITKQLTGLIVKQEPIQLIHVKFQYYKEK